MKIIVFILGISAALFAEIHDKQLYRISFPPSPSGEYIRCLTKEQYSYTIQLQKSRGYCIFQFPWLLNVAELNKLSFKLKTKTPGKIIIYYYGEDNTVAMMERKIQIIPPENTYEIPVAQQSWKEMYHAGPLGKKHRQFGGNTRRIKKLRLDFLFGESDILTLSDIVLKQ